MIRVIKASERYSHERSWLHTHFLFSFAEYYDPNNMQWGALRVFNDDMVDPHKGFAMHPHDNAEVITIPLSGEISHEDSTGSRGTVYAGEVQRMSAGSGIEHSECNHADEPVHLYQIWILPRIRNIEPSYEQRAFDPASWRNTLLPLVSGQGMNGALTMNADATIYRSYLEAGKQIDYMPGMDRCVFIYTTSGRLQVNGAALETNDQARISEETSLHLKAAEDTDLILVDVPPAGPAERVE